jgi:aspartyl-tRNA(Asn)/glutamyl-tRNA(Gln) amidotransferase subunit A
VKEMPFSLMPYLIPAYYVLTTAEASSNLSRYDGVHFGYRSPQGGDMESIYKRSRTEGFGKEVKNRIMLGTFVLSSGYYDAYYTRAQKVRRLIRDQIEAMYQECDYLLMPCTPSVAFRFGEKTDDPVAMYLSDAYTVLANLSGMPAISIPAGKDREGMPFGIQLMGKAFDEPGLFGFSKKLSILVSEI